MNDSDFHITEIKPPDKEIISEFITENWGTHIIVSKGNLINTLELPGFICIENNQVQGLITYNIIGPDCEIVTLDSQIPNQGLGTGLILKVVEIAEKNNCQRVWLITTNDNTHAIRFYQRFGFDWVGFYRNSINESRKLKPSIPELGTDDIPLLHEIEFELRI